MPGNRVYLYQTDDKGDYAPEADRPGAGAENPRLFAYVRTDAEGRATIRTILAGPYRGTRVTRHMHLHISRAMATAYGTAIYFDTDPPPDEELRQDAARGRVVVAPLEKVEMAQRARAKIPVPRE